MQLFEAPSHLRQDEEHVSHVLVKLFEKQPRGQVERQLPLKKKPEEETQPRHRISLLQDEQGAWQVKHWLEEE